MNNFSSERLPDLVLLDLNSRKRMVAKPSIESIGSKRDRQAIVSLIEALAGNTRPYGSEKLSGHESIGCEKADKGWYTQLNPRVLPDPHPVLIPPRWFRAKRRGRGVTIKDKDTLTVWEHEILARNYFHVNSLVVLQVVDDLEQVVSARISLRSKHSHKAFGGNVRCVCQFAEPDSRIYVIPQNRFPKLCKSLNQFD